MYVCDACGTKFDEPESRCFCLEEYNGVASLFPDRNYGYFDTCPECGSEEIDSFYEEEEYEEWYDD